jgi:AraC family transcriptional activator of tynA and feaB
MIVSVQKVMKHSEIKIKVGTTVVKSGELRVPSNTDCALEVWDTAYMPRGQAFGVFHDAARRSFMPWTNEIVGDRFFTARLETVRFEDGLIGRIQSTPTRAIRTQAHIDESEADCIYASLRLSGDAAITQGDAVVVARPGDLVIFDSDRPTIHTSLADSFSDAIALMIPRKTLAVENLGTDGPRLLQKYQILRPLSSCMDFMTQNFSNLSRDELNGLFDACVDILPTATGCHRVSRMSSSDLWSDNSFLREICGFVDEHLSSASLTARWIAANFDVSERYVHKLFSKRGTTCSHYVTRRRLERVHVDLLNPALRREPIALVAYRWGFKDLSTFNRAFRKLFGCSPRQLRI